MRPLSLTSLLLFFLFHTRVLGGDYDWAFSFSQEIPGWNDLRQCVRDCFAICDSFGNCPTHELAAVVGCKTRSCLCKSTVREEANDWLGLCIETRCEDTDELAETLTLFKNYCDGLYASGVSVGSDTTGPPTQPATEHTMAEQTVTATPGISTVLTEYTATKTVTQTDLPEATKTVQTSTAKRGVAFLWDSLTMLMLSLVPMIVWGVGWGGVAV